MVKELLVRKLYYKTISWIIIFKSEMALVNENLEIHKNVKVKLFNANVLQHKDEIEEVLIY